jgi:hypothetical protein
MDTDSTEGSPATTNDGDPAAAPPGGDEPFTEEGAEEAEEEADDEVDEMSKQTFPTSDPPSTWGGADKPPQR